MSLPLFPLNTVLFPGIVIPITVGRNWAAWRLRIQSTETWATVKESIAPNEYIVASRSA